MLDGLIVAGVVATVYLAARFSHLIFGGRRSRRAKSWGPEGIGTLRRWFPTHAFGDPCHVPA